MSEGQPDDVRALAHETQAQWEGKAAFWDERMGEGNDFARALIGPAIERLLGPVAGRTLLDVGCGNGVISRRLARLGAEVVACDFSPTFLERARARSADAGDRIDYRLVDATDEAQLLALGERRFDAAVASMALMDMPTIDPLLRALATLLKPGGRFVFAVMHPCFNGSATLALEMDDRGGQVRETYSVKVAAYLDIPPALGAGMIGEPTPHYYFHRPLSALLGAGFAAGFVLDGLEEPAFGPEQARPRSLSWGNFHQIPPVLVARLRNP